MLGKLIDFVFPKTCAICGRIDTFLCSDCRDSLAGAEPTCPHCRRSSPGGRTHPECRRSLGLDGLTCLFTYKQKEVKRLIETIKYQFLPGVIDSVVTEPNLLQLNFDAITFVPLHRRRQNWRGFNQAKKMAQRLADLTGIGVCDTLVRTRYTAPLARVQSRSERRERVAGAFQLKTGTELTGKSLLLVDDVYTSGATMLEAGKVLRKAGARCIWGWALAG